MMRTQIPRDFEDTVADMKLANEEILEDLLRHGISSEHYPDFGEVIPEAGEAAAMAYPMQGVLKYHGMTDWLWRISYLPSISVNNDAGHTVTYVKCDQDLQSDVVLINDAIATGREFERVERVLDAIRTIAGTMTRVVVVSKNFVRASKTGKGLGTSASAAAALAIAAIAAMLGSRYADNRRFVSCVSRLLTGSGCRSAAGGTALWFSYPGMPHEDSYAVRIDNRDQLADVRLITIPIDSRIGLKTEMAHRDAPQSPLFRCWMHNRKVEVLQCIAAVQSGNWQVVGQLAELDTIQLHAITMSGGHNGRIIAWEPENIALFRLCSDLRNDGLPVYFSVDTGPTTVLITHKEFEDEVVQRLVRLNMGVEIIRGQIAGPAQQIDVLEAKHALNLD